MEQVGEGILFLAISQVGYDHKENCLNFCTLHLWLNVNNLNWMVYAKINTTLLIRQQKAEQV